MDGWAREFCWRVMDVRASNPHCRDSKRKKGAYRVIKESAKDMKIGRQRGSEMWALFPSVVLLTVPTISTPCRLNLAMTSSFPERITQVGITKHEHDSMYTDV